MVRPATMAPQAPSSALPLPESPTSCATAAFARCLVRNLWKVFGELFLVNSRTFSLPSPKKNTTELCVLRQHTPVNTEFLHSADQV